LTTQQEHDAALCRDLMEQKPYKDQPWARMALAIAARAILRGRHLTEAEQDENLAKAFDEEGDHGIAARIRAMSNPQQTAGKP
jgi:hypothetical protein